MIIWINKSVEIGRFYILGTKIFLTYSLPDFKKDLILSFMNRTPSSDYICPLCDRHNASLYFEDKNRIYLCCRECSLVFVPPAYFLTREAEKKEYDRHTNDPADAGYQRFLSRLARPLIDRLEPGQQGLDFGCGPGPALHNLLTGHGHAVDLYDPFYADDKSLLANTYDFITATEVVEHLHSPGRVFDQLFGMLRPGGWLGIMTKQVRDKASFSRWHYIRDLTHVCFYSRVTFNYIARKHHAAVSFIGEDVILLQKQKNVP